ncbi:MAG: ATP-dependent zinc metalloprotease FtsH [Anaerolineae bacterium]|nr:ATP-dependent zinc metalloprotease FtsH [Anaerolineae bacterium]
MQSRQPQDQNPPTPSAVHWAWWVLLLALVAWNIWLFRPVHKPAAHIPYSAFVAQVRADNVNSVRIAGDTITGQFVQPIAWPQPTPGTTPTKTSSGRPTPGNAATYTSFSTNFPQDIGDPGLMALLEQHRVVVDVAPPPSPLLAMVLSNGLPLLLLVLLMVWMGRQMAKGQTGAFSFGRSKARQYTGAQTGVTFDDVAGADEAKEELQEVVDFLRNPQKYHMLGARIPCGILLVGPPGTGKTLMAKAVAGEADVPFFSLSASEFVEMFVGVGASRVRDLFKQAKEATPSIVFIDELDAVGRRRGAGLGAVNDEREQTLNQLLVEMDGFDERHEVIVLAATNRPDVLDPALLRPGRFDRQVVVGLPDRRGREGILRIHTREMPLASDVDLGLLARTTTGFSGADLANLCNEAALITARAHRDQVTMADFEEAVDKVLLGGVRPMLLDARERRVVAYHEAGHALVAWLTPAADPVQKVTIIPRGRALGVTEQLPSEDHYNYSREYLLARLTVMLGGRTAEEITIGDVTTGAENDLVEATKLARRMVTRWGMGNLGLVAFQAEEEQPFLGCELAQGRDYSESTAAHIDRDVQRLLEERHEAARQLLLNARELLDRLAEALLKEETVEQAELVQILGPRPEEAGEVVHNE